MTDRRSPTSDAAGTPLVGVALRHLGALAAIADEGSFSGAAVRLGYVQSAVSGQLADLERRVGMRLVERSRGSATVSLTPAGQLLLEHAKDLLVSFDAAQADLAALAEGRRGTLRLGTTQSVATALLPRITAEFARACPGFTVQQTLGDSDIPLVDLLETGVLDLAFCELPCHDPPLACVELMDDPLVLLVSVRSPLAQPGNQPSVAALAGLPFVGFRADSRVHAQLIETLARHDVEPRFTYHVDLNSTLQALVAADLGVAIVPKLAIDPADPGTTTIELPELPSRRISLGWLRDREPSPAAVRFTEIARTVTMATPPLATGSTAEPAP